MKRIEKIFAALSILALCSCATKGTMENLADNRQQMDQVRGQIDRTMYSLDNLVRAPAAEIKDSQSQYASNVKSLRKMADQLDEGAKNARQRKVDYLTEWERAQLTVENPELQRAGERRRKQVTQSLTQLESSLRSANEGVAPLVTDLEDIERVTSNDPTPAGVAAIKSSGIVQAAKKRANTANSRLDVAANRFDKALASLSPQPGTRPVATAAAPAAAAAGAAGASAAQPSSMPTFSQADRNANGTIEREEAEQIPGLDFAAADRDKDGKLSESEYEAARKAQPAAIGGSKSSTSR